MINHDGDSIWAHSVTKIMKVVDLMPTLPSILPFAVIGVDEGQFFNNRDPTPCTNPESIVGIVVAKYEIERFCNVLANLGKIVIVAALDGTFTKKPFKVISHLIPHCDEVTKLNAVCKRCGDNAPFSRKLIPDINMLDVGGDQMYEANCRKCYTTMQQQYTMQQKYNAPFAL